MINNNDRDFLYNNLCRAAEQKGKAPNHASIRAKKERETKRETNCRDSTHFSSPKVINQKNCSICEGIFH